MNTHIAILSSHTKANYTSKLFILRKKHLHTRRLHLLVLLLLVCGANFASAACPAELATDGFDTTVSNTAELIEAMECANINGEGNGGDTLRLGADIPLTTLYGTPITDPTEYYFSATGTPEINTTLTVDGQGHTVYRDIPVCNLDASHSSDEFRLFKVVSGGKLSLQDLTLRGGCLDLGAQGGAIEVTDGELNAVRIIVENNQVYSHMAGIKLVSGSRFDIGSALIRNNFARGGVSGIYIRESSGTLSNTTFLDNLTSVGGALGIVQSTSVALSNLSFENNISANQLESGAMGVSFSTVTLEHSSFINNSGAINNNVDTVDLTVTNSLFSGNDAGDCTNNGFTGSNNLTDDSNCPGALGAPTSIDSALADNGCLSTMPDGSCLPTLALMSGSNALDVATSSSLPVDARGFLAFAQRDIGSFEAQPPQLFAPADINTELTATLTPVALGSATVTDDTDETLVATADNLGPFALGTTTVTWTVIDSHGFSASDTQQVNIVLNRDASSPLPEGGDGAVAFDTTDTNCSFVSGPTFSPIQSTSVPAPTELEFIGSAVAEFTIGNCNPGASVDITLSYPQTLPTDAELWKLTGSWSLVAAVISGPTVSYTVIDGGPGDADGAVNGRIVDPVGVATTVPSEPSPPVPPVPGDYVATPVPAGNVFTYFGMVVMLLVFRVVFPVRFKARE